LVKSQLMPLLLLFFVVILFDISMLTDILLLGLLFRRAILFVSLLGNSLLLSPIEEQVIQPFFDVFNVIVL
jgi:hypothetical protein